MASVAEKKRRRKQAVSLGRAPPKPEASPLAPRSTARVSSYVRRQSGLEQLAGRGKLNQRQRHSLDRYGRLYRIARIEDSAALKSSLADLEGARGAIGGGLPTLENYADVILQARNDLAGARAVMSFQFGLILACDEVCGEQKTPQDITDVRSEQTEIEVCLRLAGDALAKYFDEVGWRLS